MEHLGGLGDYSSQQATEPYCMIAMQTAGSVFLCSLCIEQGGRTTGVKLM
jgi:hypothetical protein